MLLEWQEKKSKQLYMYWKHYIPDGNVAPSELPRLRLVDHLYTYDIAYLEVSEFMVRKDVPCS